MWVFLFVCFFSFLQTVVQSSPSPHADALVISSGCGAERYLGADPAGCGSLHAVCSAENTTLINFGVISDLMPWSFCSLSAFVFIHLPHPHLPLHQTGMYKAGSVCSGQAIFLPFV